MEGNQPIGSLNEQGDLGVGTSTSNEEYRLTGYNSVEQLRVLYEIRVRENQQLNSVVLELEAKTAQQTAMMVQMTNICDEYDARLALSNERTAAVELEAIEIKEKIAILENSNRKMQEQVTLLKTITSDQQEQLLILQGKNGPDNLAIADSILRAAEQKHQKEIMSLQAQLQKSSDVMAQKFSDLENLRHIMREHEVSIDEKHEKMKLEFEDSGKTFSADFIRNLLEANDMLRGVIAELQAKDEDIMALKNVLQEKELKLSPLKTRDLLFCKLIVAFAQDLKQLSLETLATAPATSATISHVAELKQSNKSCYKELMEYVHSQSPSEIDELDIDIHMEVLRNRILNERVKNNATLTENCAAKMKMIGLVGELRTILADRDDYARQLSEQSERAAVQHVLFAATQAKVDSLENQLKQLLTGKPPDLPMKDMRKSSQ